MPTMLFPRVLILGLILVGNVNCLLKSMSMMTSKYLGKSPVFVAGATRGVGLEIVKQLSELGTPVHALVRPTSSSDTLMKLPGVKITLGDAMDEAAVQSCMEGCVAAITTLGGKGEDGVSRIDYTGNSNVVEQVKISRL